MLFFYPKFVLLIWVLLEFALFVLSCSVFFAFIAFYFYYFYLRISISIFLCNFSSSSFSFLFYSALRCWSYNACFLNSYWYAFLCCYLRSNYDGSTPTRPFVNARLISFVIEAELLKIYIFLLVKELTCNDFSTKLYYLKCYIV